MSKEQRQKELRERLESEIRFENRVNNGVGSVVGQLGSLPRVRMDHESPDDRDVARAFVRMRVMQMVFEKEGCL